MKRVLLIEDDSNLSYSISLLLSLNNHEVVIADSFKEGLIKIETNTPDIIISEIVLPAYSALDFLSDLKHDEILRDIPCVFLTSVVDESEMQKLLKSGASEIIVKPFKTKKFLESIEKYIGKSLEDEFPLLVCDKRLTEHREFIFGLRKQNISPVFEEKVQDLFELLTVRQFSGIVFGFGSDDETGLRLIEWVRSKEELSNIPIITLGSDSGNCEPEKIIEAGADDFFPYPYIITELVSETAAKVNRYEAYKKRIQLAENEVPGFEEYEVVNEESKGASSRKKRLKHILIIEDDIPLCENLEMHLKMNSFTVTKADRGLSGIEMASLRMPDLIICDIMLPDIDGFLVLEQLNKKVSTSSIPFIFLSAKSEISDIRRGMILGANSYVTKPFSATKLLQLISSQLEKTKYANILKHRSELYPNDVSVKKTIEMLIEESKRPSAFTPEKAAETRSNLKDLFKRHSGAHPTPEPVNQPEEKKVAEPEKEEIRSPETFDKYSILDGHNIFLGQRDISKDFQKIPHKDIAVLLVNLERAVVKESNQFNQFLTGVMRQGFKKIIIDFGFATYIDSIFVGVLVAAIKKIEAQACNIKLVVSDEKIFSNPIIASNLSRIFEIFTDIPTAISSFKDNG